MAAPKDSAVLLAWRPSASNPSGREVLWLRRGPKLAFGAGFYAFPGGKLDPSDAEVAVVGATGQDAALRACAVRECFEETGLLVARGAERLSHGQLRELRAKLVAGTLGFALLLAENRLTIDATDLVEAGRWITPPFYPSRFDARFFLAQAPAQEIVLSEAEVSDGGFISPEAALARWREGTALLHPPNWNAMVAFQAQEPALLDRLRHPPLTRDHITNRIEFQEGIVLTPQRTPTLPPATHTNAYLLGLTDLAIVDPGSDDDAELAVLLEVIEALRAEGRQPVAIALTHHHHDHVGGVPKLQKALGLPVWAHSLAVEPLRRAGIQVARTLADREPLGLRGFPLTALHTPGHTRGHVTYWHEPSGAAIVGDLISGVSTIVIDPPEGNMADYLRSLERLLTIKAERGAPARRPELPGVKPELTGVTTLYPAHGPVMADAPAKLREYLDHRRDREHQILEALRAGAGTPAEIVPRIYQGTPEFLFPIAERSVQAHLDKLAAEGQIEVRAERYLAL
jgi:glyoxylase-like metal-dependent hydrolase (beta-lactamase superfamily II)/8-oxo-dGTP pyrophosphatase MutT (NUDIX family)